MPSISQDVVVFCLLAAHICHPSESAATGAATTVSDAAGRKNGDKRQIKVIEFRTKFAPHVDPKAQTPEEYFNTCKASASRDLNLIPNSKEWEDALRRTVRLNLDEKTKKAFETRWDAWQKEESDKGSTASDPTLATLQGWLTDMLAKPPELYEQWQILQCLEMKGSSMQAFNRYSNEFTAQLNRCRNSGIPKEQISDFGLKCTFYAQLDERFQQNAALRKLRMDDLDQCAKQQADICAPP